MTNLPRSYPASVMNEFFTIRLARAVGRDVPRVYRRYLCSRCTWWSASSAASLPRASPPRWALGASTQTAQRELDAMLQNLPTQASRLLTVIEASIDEDIARRSRPERARRHRADVLRLLRMVVNVVVRDTAAQVARR